jgi:hypothetical protein
MMSALKFGWNACFSASKAGKSGVSDADLDAIIDRTRGITTSATLPVKSELAKSNNDGNSNNPKNDGNSSSVSSIITTSTDGAIAPSTITALTSSTISTSAAQLIATSTASVASTSASSQLQEGLENTVADFDESVPFTNIRLFEGECLQTVAKSTMGDISKSWIQVSVYLSCNLCRGRVVFELFSHNTMWNVSARIGSIGGHKLLIFSCAAGTSQACVMLSHYHFHRPKPVIVNLV